MSELEPITPEAALDYYVDARRGEVAKATLRDHEYRLQTFTDWCEDEGITNLNDVDLRDVHRWRVWKREERGCNINTMHGQVSTLRTFLRVVAGIGGVRRRVAENIRVPTPGKDERSDDTKISPERAHATLDWLSTYEYAGQRHVTFLLAWRIPLRRGSIRALDLDDWLPEEQILQVRHRPPETPLKNGDGGERDVNIASDVAAVVDDYLANSRRRRGGPDDRESLIVTREGRPVVSTVQQWIYQVTRPCVIGDPCPHDEDPETCEAATYSGASKCPSSRSPHQIRTGSVTAHRNAGTPRDVLSDRADASERVLDEHYDKAGLRDQAKRRRDHLPDSI